MYCLCSNLSELNSKQVVYRLQILLTTYSLQIRFISQHKYLLQQKHTEIQR